MQDDKELKELLKKWGVEHPAANFTSRVMQQVTSTYSAHPQTPPLFKQTLPRILICLFILVCSVMLALSLKLPGKALPFQFEIQLPIKYLYQGFSFLIAFWTVMLFNLSSKNLSTFSGYSR